MDALHRLREQLADRELLDLVRLLIDPCTAIISNTEIIPVTVPNSPIRGQMAMVVLSSSIRAVKLLDASEIHASRIL